MTVRTRLGYCEMITQMRNMEGYRVEQELRSLGTVLAIFDRNFQVLKDQVKFCETNEELDGIKNRKKLHGAMVELIRRLHNYLATIKTLIDNTRRVRKKFDKINYDFRKIPEPNLHSFIIGLRNFILHYNASKMAKKTMATPIAETKEWDVKQKMIISKDELVSWTRWPAESKKFLETYNEDDGFFSLCEKHYDIFRNFNTKFYEHVVDKYLKEIKEFRAFQKRILEYYPPPKE